MTFNVQGATYPEEGPNSWGSRTALNVGTIKRYTPDMIGFQEIQGGNLATYRKRLTDYDHVAGKCYGDVEPTEFTSIFWKHERFELVESGEFWLSETPDEPSTGWGVPYPMGATWVRLRCRDDGNDLVHLNTHLDRRPPSLTRSRPGRGCCAPRRTAWATRTGPRPTQMSELIRGTVWTAGTPAVAVAGGLPSLRDA